MALMIMAIMLAIVLGLNAVLVGQIKTIRNMGYSVVAFYAAETGIERELYENHAVPTSYSGYLDLNGNGVQDTDDSSYNISVFNGASCLGTNYCIKSIGIFQGTRRAIQVSR